MKIILRYALIFGSISIIQAQNINECSPVDHAFTHVEHGGVYFADFNGDHNKDVILYGLNMEYPYTPVLEIYLADKPLTYKKLETPELPGIFDGDIAIADLDNDGDLDVVISGLDKNRQPVAGIILNENRSETFRFIQPEVFKGVNQSSIGLLDYNTDGKTDILISGISHFNIQTNLYQYVGPENYKRIEHPFPDVYNGSLCIKDINNDGKSDVILSGIDKTNIFLTAVYLKSDQGNEFKTTESMITPSVKGNIEFIHLNDDNLPDLIVNGEQMYNHIQLEAYTNNGDGTFTLTDLGENIKGSIHGNLHVFDANLDGREDILITGWNGTKNHADLHLQGEYTWTTESLPFSTRFSGLDIRSSELSEYMTVITTGKTKDNTTKSTLWAINQSNVEFHEEESDRNVEIKYNNTTLLLPAEYSDLGQPEVYDILGRNRTNDVQITSSTTINIQSLPTGSYILKYPDIRVPFVVQ